MRQHTRVKHWPVRIGCLLAVGALATTAACGSSSPAASRRLPSTKKVTGKPAHVKSRTSPSRSVVATTTTAPPSTVIAPSATTTTTTTAPANQPELLVLIGGQGVVRPTTFDLVQDGSSYMSGLTWSAWSAAGATGSGTLYVDSCTPSCASGGVSSYPASVSLGAATQTQWGQVFSSISITVPSNPSESQTYTLPR